jgi:hypothetical protein
VSLRCIRSSSRVWSIWVRYGVIRFLNRRVMLCMSVFLLDLERYLPVILSRSCNLRGCPNTILGHRGFQSTYVDALVRFVVAGASVIVLLVSDAHASSPCIMFLYGPCTCVDLYDLLIC